MNSLAAIAAAILMAHPPAQARDWPSVGGYDITQLESSCAMGADYTIPGRADVGMTLVYDGESPRLFLASSDWSAQEGQEYELTFDVGESSFTGPALGYVIDYTRKGFVTKFGATFLDAFAGASRIYVTRGETVVANLNLKGSAIGVAALRRCAAYVSAANSAQARREERFAYIAADPFAPAHATEAEVAADADRVEVLTNPSWASAPRPDFPERAESRGITSGRVELECAVSANGSITACSVLSETPSGAGFGAAALAASRRSRLSPRSVDGVAAGGKLRFSVPFSL